MLRLKLIHVSKKGPRSDNLFCMKSLYNEAYRKTSSISRTKSQNLNVSCILLQLSLLNPLKPGVKLRMKMCDLY